MKRKKEKVPGFDEIIFENRNKVYGAYDLRKKYIPATIWSIIGGSGLFIAMVIAFSLGTGKDVTAEPRKEIIIVVRIDSTLQDVNRLKQEEPPKLEVKVTPYVAPEIKETIDTGDVVLAAVASIDTVKNKPVDIITIPVGDPDPVVVAEPDPLIIVTEPPEFPGGEAALLRFINNNIKYPEEAISNNIEGRVTLRFVVSTDGTVRRVEILKGVDPLLNEEAARVISILPKWKPGKNNGTPAAVWFSVPVNFTLKK
jgi:periplasmic protein TonB